MLYPEIQNGGSGAVLVMLPPDKHTAKILLKKTRKK